MKKNTLLISFISVLVLGVLLAGSIIIFDRDNIKNEVSDNNSIGVLNTSDDILTNGKVISSEDINEDIKKITSDKFNLALVVKEGNPRIELISMTKKEMDLKNIIEYSVKDGNLSINTKGDINSFTFPFNKYTLVVYLEHMSDLDIEMKDLNGVLSVENDMRNMKVENIDGVLNLNSRMEKLNIDSIDGVINVENDLSYDISINEINGVGNISFDFMNAKINIKDVEGLATIMGSTVNIFGDDKSYHNTYGEGLNTIDITDMEGILNID